MKPWYKSKTNWLNIGAVATTIVGAITVSLGGLQGILTLEQFAIVSVVVNVINLVLRNYFTDTKIG